MVDESIVKAMVSPLRNLDFLWKVGGISRTAVSNNSAGKLLRYPVAKPFASACSTTSSEEDFTPNDRLNGICFCKLISNTSTQLESDTLLVDLVVGVLVWLSPKCQTATDINLAKMSVMDTIPSAIKDSDTPSHINAVSIKYLGETVDSQQAWGEYSFDEANTQYLSYPAGWFQLNYRVKYIFSSKC